MSADSGRLQMERWGAIPAVFVIIINVAALTAMVEDLEKKNRVERKLNTRLTVDLDLAPRRNRRAHVQLPIDDQTVGIIGKFAGGLIRCRPASVSDDRPAGPRRSSQSGDANPNAAVATADRTVRLDTDGGDQFLECRHVPLAEEQHRTYTLSPSSGHAHSA
jgi:hypothetical protein